jgi:hypothetical protein
MLMILLALLILIISARIANSWNFVSDIAKYVNKTVCGTTVDDTSYKGRHSISKRHMKNPE